MTAPVWSGHSLGSGLRLRGDPACGEGKRRQRADCARKARLAPQGPWFADRAARSAVAGAKAQTLDRYGARAVASTCPNTPLTKRPEPSPPYVLAMSMASLMATFGGTRRPNS